MTDRERIQKTYGKIAKKYPEVSEKDEVDTLAIRQEKRFSLLCCLGLGAGAILCAVLAVLVESLSSSRYLLVITGAFQVFEIFRILSKYSLIEKMYKPVEFVSPRGMLTQSRILNDGKKLLKKAGNQFSIVKLPLYDKEDDTQIGYDNVSFHVQKLYFKVDGYGRTGNLRTNMDTYASAALGAMYYVVLTPQNEIAAAYQASNWELDAALTPLCRQPAEPVDQGDHANVSPLYQPAPVVQTTQKEETKKLLPILALVLAVVSYFTVMILCLPMLLVSLILSLVALAQQRSKLSVASAIITAVLVALMAFAVVASMMFGF